MSSSLGMKFAGPSFKDRYATFAKKTTFHGFSELHDSTTFSQRIIWVIVIGLFTAVLAMFVTKQACQYMEGQTATKVSKLDEEMSKSTSPVIFYLDEWSWIDMEKVKYLGITPDEVGIAMGYMRSFSPYTFSLPPIEARKSLKATMKRLNVSKILEFYALISRDSFDGILPESMSLSKIFADARCNYLVNTSRKAKAPFGEALVFLFDFNFTSFQMIRDEQFRFLGWNASENNQKPPKLLNIDTYMEIPLRSGYDFMMNTQTSIYRKISDCTPDHPIDDLYYTKQCQLECELQANQTIQAANCISYNDRIYSIELTPSFKKGNLTFCYMGYLNVSTGRVEGGESPVYKNLTRKEMEERDKDVESCRKKCLPACDQWATSWSVAMYEVDKNWDQAVITIVFPDPKNLIVIEEFKQYEWYDLVSDLGGLVGLWLGASMMSIFQTCHLCLFPKAKRKMEVDLFRKRVDPYKGLRS